MPDTALVGPRAREMKNYKMFQSSKLIASFLSINSAKWLVTLVKVKSRGGWDPGGVGEGGGGRERQR